MIEKITGHAKDILFFCSMYDMNFPRVCGTVSSYLHDKMFESPDLILGYSVSLVRGHYILDSNELCGSFDIDGELFVPVERHETFQMVDFPCTDCSCDNSIEHTWLEFKNDITNSISIVDFTSYQFHKNFGDLEQKLIDLTGEFDKNSLYELISGYNEIVVTEDSKKYAKYYPDVYYLDKDEAQFHEAKQRESLNNRITELENKDSFHTLVCKQMGNDEIQFDVLNKINNLLEVKGYSLTFLWDKDGYFLITTLTGVCLYKIHPTFEHGIGWGIEFFDKDNVYDLEEILFVCDALKKIVGSVDKG